MDFSLTEEQQLLKDSVDRFVRENYEFEDRRKHGKIQSQYDRPYPVITIDLKVIEVKNESDEI